MSPLALVALVLALVAPPARAGLRFRQVPTLSGAQATALASDGTSIWAGTPNGVWRLASGAWAADGLAGKKISSLAVVAGDVYAADGATVWKRSAACTPSTEPGGPCVPIWNAESLPAGVSRPVALASDGASLWAAGSGVAKKSGGAWSALASPGAIALSAAVWSGDLVAGLRGGVARYAGASFTLLTSGLPSTDSVQALSSVGGSLYAGTDQTLYQWSGTTWVADPTFGFHDVRGITGAGGALRAATADAGVRTLFGVYGWASDNAGILPPGVLSLASAGTDLYAGTAGGPVYRLSGSSWTEAGTGPWAATISDVTTHGGSTWFGARGAGFSRGAASGWFGLDGCGDVKALAGAGSLQLFAATNCDVYSVFFTPGGGIGAISSASSGLPVGVLPTTLARVSADGSVAGGTNGAGMWRFVFSSWSADNGGLSGTESILAVRQVGSSLFATTGPSLFMRRQSGWQPATGEPALVQALGGDATTLFAAGATGISSATLGGALPAAWRNDDAGASTAFVSSLDAGSGFAFAAGGTAGILRRKGGGWQPETAGVAAGADARVVRLAPGLLYAGTAANGLFAADVLTSAKAVPVVLDVTGGTGARFHSDLTLGNASDAAVNATLLFVGAPDFPGSGTGSATVGLAPHTELRAPDALQFLRDHGIAIPATAAGALVVSADPSRLPAAGTDGLYALSRTFTRDAAGSYGVFLDGVSDLDAAEETGAVYGLRSVAGVSRSNLALAHLPGRGADPVTLSVQVYDQSGAAAGPPIVVTLAPGEWRQLNGILLSAGLAEPAYGYARIVRTAGIGSWTGYGVVNDARTSDGSILPLYRPGGPSAARRLVVPVVLDVFGAAGSHYTTELTLANDGAFGTPVDLFYKPALGSSTGVAVVTLTLAAGQQTTIPDVIAYLRAHGLNVPDASTGPQAGTLTAEFRNLFNLDAPRTAAIARTTTPNPNAATGGAFGVAYAAAAKGGGARASAIVPGLTRDATVRSNLAVVHLGGGSESALSLSVQLYDAATAQPVGSVVSVSLLPGDWTQWSGIFDVAGVPAGVTTAYAVVTRVSGDDTWLAYGVLNDAQTSDGSFLRMIPGTEY